MTYTKYEWTAFTEADFLGQGGNGTNIGCGDSFTMPASATVCMSTYDDDGSLSGDTVCSENSNDTSGQYASVDGGRVGSQMYAESYHVLRGSDGKTYYLIEIEVEGYDAPGAGDDYFTFYGAVPPAGVELTVTQTCNVTGSWVDYKCLGAGEKVPPNTPPTFTNLPADGIICIDENTTFVIDVNADDVDGDTLTYEIVGGRDAAFFEIDAATGELTFKTGPDYENPQSGGDSNTYDVTVKVSDGNGGTETKALWVKVKDVEETTPGNGECIVIEAETMNLNGYYVDNRGDASGGAGIKLSTSNGSPGYASTKFTGADGEYDLTLTYMDESDGQGYIDIFVNGVFQHCIDLSQDNNGDGFDGSSSWSTLTLDNLELTTGDVVTFKGRGNVGEYARIDKIELCQDGEACATVETLGPNLIVNGDFEANVLNNSGSSLGMSGALTSGWYDIGSAPAQVHEQDYGHGNATGDAIVELECGVVICQMVDVTEAGTYRLCFDVTRRGTSDQDNKFELWIDGQKYETIIAEGEETLIFDLDLAAGQHRFDFKSLSQSYIGAGLDDVKLQKVTEVEQCDGALEGRYFCDDNRDGVDNGEPGIAGIAVALLDAAGNAVLDSNGVAITTVTGANGEYSFTGLHAGDYRVAFDADPTGKTFIQQDVGGDDTIDSDVDQNTGVTGVVSVTEGETTSDVDAGVEAQPGSISGTYFCDENRDGDDDGAAAGDADVAGKTVTLLNADGTPAVDADGNAIAPVLTDANGDYSFGNLAAGDYKVMFEGTDGKDFIAQDAGNDDTDDSDVNPSNGMTGTVSLTQGENVTDVDAGVEAQPGSISGTYFCDENRDGDDDGAAAGDADVAGKTVTLLNADGTPATDIDGNAIASVLTDANGDYSFGNLAAGDYKVMFEGTDGKDFIAQDAGNDDTDDSDVDATGMTAPVTVNAGQNTGDVDAGVQTILGSLSGKYFSDDNNNDLDDDGANGVGGVTVELLDAAGNPTGASTTTAADGSYSFGDLAPGTYGVKFTDTVSGKTLVDANANGNANDDIDSDATDIGGGMSTITGITVTGGNDTPDNDAGVETVPVGSISGTYFCDENRDGDDDGAAAGDADVAGKTVTLLNADGTPAVDADGNPVASVLTDANGNYSFGNLDAGDYKVMFEGTDDKDFIAQDAGNDDTDDSDVNPSNGMTGTVSLTQGENVTDVDAGVEAQPGSISGTYFCDENRDGDDDGAAAGDADVAGKTVTLLNADGTPAVDADGNAIAPVLTDANGDYSFGNLAAGDYKVMFEGTDGKDFIAQDAGNDDTDDSDVNPSNGMTGTVSLTQGENVTDVDAGVEAQPGSISGTYFCDENRDGDDDGAAAGDADVAGKTVTLLNADGTPATDIDGNAIASVLTDANGDYSFGNLAAGDYKVMFEGTDGKDFIAQDAGNDDTDDSDVDATGMTAPVTVNAGQNTGDVDAGVQTILGSLSGKYFSDDNNNDLDDDGANGVGGVTVELLDAAGNPTGASTTTAADGSYSFGDLAPGTYGVKFTDTVSGKTLVDANANGNANDDIDSDATDIGGGMSTITGITVTGGNDTPDNDAGVETVPVGSISGTYFCDENRDGDDDGAAAGDADVAGKTVTLLNADGTPAVDADGNPVASVLTDANGNYSFGNLDAGDYKVMFEGTDDKDFIAQDAGNDDTDDSDVDATGMTAPVTVNAGQNTGDVDAGVQTILGSLSGKYFSDDNNNDLDDDGANGIGGVTVELLDAAGNPTGASTTTAADGSYSFGDLAPGTYGVKFTDTVSGKTLVDANANGNANDDIDSDATDIGGGMSTITGITVTGGNDTPDNDAGVENIPPAPQDDAAMTCADEDVTVDVLANDGDPSLTITAVDGQAITEGNSITTATGVVVTLVAGELVFDGEAAYAALDIGETALDTISYTVSDGTDTTDANVAVTFCGDANTVASLCDSLPDSPVSYKIADSFAGTSPYSSFGYDVQITAAGGDARFEGVVFEQAYCLDIFSPASGGSTFATAPVVTADMFCADDAAAASVFGAGQVGINGETAADNMDLITWILNQDYENNGAGSVDGEFTGWEVQFAIWELTNSVNSDPTFAAAPEAGQVADTDYIISQAIANGEGFQAGVGDVVGVILDPNPSTTTNAQPFILAMNFEDYDCLC